MAAAPMEQPELLMSDIYTVNVQLGALPTAGTIYSDAVYLGAKPTENDVTIEQYSKHADVTWGSDVWDWSVSSSGSVWAIWKMTPYNSLGSGKIRVTVHGVSDSCGEVKLMAATNYDATATPDLTLNTSPIGGLAVCTSRALLGTTKTYQTGYFAIVTGPAAHTVGVEITKIEWLPSAGGTHEIWTQLGVGNIRTSGVRQT